ncbi:probable membrane-associated kinase regulator 2 [Salvia miltiorrhiza]|uniref:probable membrane-associated kinase regulator 2 n=1 Tax=Salvia miltiorrhiza TaxID=226208 RepID=UPI0025ACE652|nr:probable membrane-associated kinase regulator 2 [Salvia miltiorrhiza]
MILPLRPRQTPPYLFSHCPVLCKYRQPRFTLMSSPSSSSSSPSLTTLSDSPMEAFRALEFQTTSPAAATAAPFADDDGDSFFDLVLGSPDSVAVTRRGVAAEKDFRFIESPRDVFVRGNGFVNSRPLCKVTLVRSTPKFRVFMLGFRKSAKCERSESNGEAKRSPLNQFPKSSKIEESNRLSVTCRVEKTPGTCRVAGANSLRSQLLKETFDYENSPEKSSRGSLPKYLKLIRPLYLLVWRRQHEKTKSTESSTPSASPVTVPASLSPKRISDGSRIGNFKIAARRFGKSRSVSTAVSMSPQPARRRDDSLLERHDGIQNAVLFCKKSYNSSSKEISKLFQSSVDPLPHGRSSCEEPKRCSI